MEAVPKAKERLIRSAALLFYSRSYGAVGVQELCEHADVRRGSFYYHFPSKEALVLAVLEHEQRELTEEVFEAAFYSGGEPLGRFQRFLERLYDYHERRIRHKSGSVGGCPIANLGQELGTQYEDICDKAAEILDGFTQIYAGAIADAVEQGELPADVNPRITAERVSAYIQGALEAAKLQGDLAVLRRLGIDVRGLIVRDARNGASVTE